jgi:nucleoside-diphosphate-sugar epimerase
VIHLAASTTTDATDLDDYSANTIGTFNVIEAVRHTPSVSRVVITSSQHVRKPGSGYPKRDDEYFPHGSYGESKVVTELLTRKSNLNCIWTIIRPTTIWGPGHSLLKNGLWRVMKNGHYFHPKDDPVIRSYGYIKNAIWQIEKILDAAPSLVDRKTYYVGDELVKQVFWVNSFSKEFVGRNVFEVPKKFIRLLSLFGDLLGLIGIKFPMTSPRYFNLTTTNPVPIARTTEVFGHPPYTLDHGIRETLEWVKVKIQDNTGNTVVFN